MDVNTEFMCGAFRLLFALLHTSMVHHRRVDVCIIVSRFIGLSVPTSMHDIARKVVNFWCKASAVEMKITVTF